MIATLLLACSEYKVEDQGDVYGNGDHAPRIEVDPARIVFDPAAPGTEVVRTITMRSIGEEDLHVFGASLTGSGAFTLPHPPAAVVLAPEESFTFDVAFAPANVEDDAIVTITSNDPDLGTLPVPVAGSGLFPDLVLSPDPYDFGRTPIGCAVDGEISLVNAGLAPLVVASVAAVGADFELLDHDPLPDLAPGEATTVHVRFSPEAAGTSTGELWVDSNVPAGLVSSSQRGTGTTEGAGEDDFIQGDGPWDATDILVYVDQSCSMGDDQANLVANFSQFTDALAEVEVDWQLLIATDDDGCANGGLLDIGTPDLESLVSSGVRGPGGAWTEAGLTVSTHALEESDAGCNAGFLRAGAKTTLILVSDEPEQSRAAWDEYVARIRALAPTTSIHSVVGDVPGGCPSAAPGNGYVEASLATGGVVLSICDGDWGSYFETIAGLASTGAVAVFPLSGRPDPATIAVTVDEVRVSNWVYRSDLNAIEFPAWALPPPLSRIHVTYDWLETCAG